jgi:hypothetical protein
MEKQNITLALPKDILRKVKIIAVQEGTSVSGLLTRLLKELVSHEEGYETAHRSHLTTLEKGIDLGTEGTTRWTREELHER